MLRMMRKDGQRSLRKDKSGQFGMMFAIIAPAIIACSGLAVDYAFMVTARDDLRASLDAGLLAAARVRTNDMDERTAAAQTFAETNIANAYRSSNLTVTVAAGAQDGELVGTATMDVRHFFGELFGRPSTTILVSSSVQADSPGLELMLVLDNTGSMGGPKIAALKSAASDLVNQVMVEPTTKVGIVPFARYVNIGMSLRNEPGFSIPADVTNCSSHVEDIYGPEYNCRTEPDTCYTAGTSYACTRTECNDGFCQSVPDTCYTAGTPYACTQTVCDQDVIGQQTVNHCHTQEWNGCVGSRMEPLNAEDSNLSTTIPGLLDVGCGNSPITRLTSTKATVLAGVTGLSPSGETYIPSGLMMGWHALSYRAILPDGTDPASLPADRLVRAIVLMTDGTNTASKNASSGWHEESDTVAADNLTRDLCQNINNDGIVVYTVGFDVSGPIETLLRNCATDHSKAFLAANAADLAAAFGEIGDSLTRLRVTR
jgi:Flp pilus assembly protein TadG